MADTNKPGFIDFIASARPLDPHYIEMWYEESSSGSDPLPFTDTLYERATESDNAEAVILQRTRSVLFLDAFKRFFGTGAQESTLNDCIAAVDKLGPAAKFISPRDYEAMFKRLYPGANPMSPIDEFPKAGTPRDRLVSYLKFDVCGHYLWHKGFSKAFIAWLDRPEMEIPNESTLNCWEMVFYLAIKAGYVKVDALRHVYAQRAQQVQLLTDVFGPYMTEYDLSASQWAPLRPGDIVLTDRFEHVVAVIEQGVAGRLEETIVVELWGMGRGAFTSSYSTVEKAIIDDFQSEDVRKFWVIRMDGAPLLNPVKLDDEGHFI